MRLPGLLVRVRLLYSLSEIEMLFMLMYKNTFHIMNFIKLSYMRLQLSL